MNYEDKIKKLVEETSEAFKLRNNEETKAGLAKIERLAGRDVASYCKGVFAQSQIVSNLSMALVLSAIHAKNDDVIAKSVDAAISMAHDYQEGASLTSMLFLIEKVKASSTAMEVHRILGDLVVNTDRAFKTSIKEIVESALAINEQEGGK